MAGIFRVTGAVVLEKFAQAKDKVIGPRSEVGDGAVPELVFIAVRSAQQSAGQ